MQEATQSEFFDMKSKLDEVSSGHSASLELLQEDLDRANLRADAYQKEVGECD
jgi:hypothetical protein